LPMDVFMRVEVFMKVDAPEGHLRSVRPRTLSRHCPPLTN
jgi:hypothetical protein